MSKRKSLLNGFLALPLGYWELVQWVRFKIWSRRPLSFERVSEVWLDRSPTEVLLFILGQFMFLSWPALLSYKYPQGIWWKVACCLSALFASFTFITLFVPIGARKRYKWLCSSGKTRTGYERLFLGQMQPNLLLSSRGLGAQACLIEILLYVLLIASVAALTQFSLWNRFQMEAFTVPFQSNSDGVSIPASVTWADFFYFSAVTMSTTGFGDIYPKIWQSQLVAIVEILLGWMYLAALLPSLINLALAYRGIERKGELRLGRFRGIVIQNSIQTGLSSIRNEQEEWGGWRARLPSDLAATAVATLLLQRLREKINEAGPASDHLRQWLLTERHQAEDQDPVGAALAEIVTRKDIAVDRLSELIDRATRKHKADEHVPMLISLVAFLSNNVLGDVTLADLPDDLPNWREKYGPHWEGYALVARMLQAHRDGDQGSVNKYATELMNARNTRGSWNGDTLLTSLVSLALNRVRYGESVYIGGASWVKALVNYSLPGVPVVKGLEVWDTAWVVTTLLNFGFAPDVIMNGAEWLAWESDRASHRGPAWSWSEEGSLICCDSTSLVCGALRQLRLEDVRIERSLLDCLELLESIKNDKYQWPTFVKDGLLLGHCPIISARCTALLDLSGANRGTAADLIIEEVAKRDWQSEWFDDPAITYGLVLSYLAPYCNPTQPSALELVERLRVRAASGPLGPEVAATALMGLIEAKIHLGLKQDLSESFTTLLTVILGGQTAGMWKGSSVGVFGFGRRYSDDIFATCLSLSALSRYPDN